MDRNRKQINNRKRKSMSMRNRLSFAIFSIYILFLIMIAAAMFRNKSAHTKKTVSIYKVVADEKAANDEENSATYPTRNSEEVSAQGEETGAGESKELVFTQPVQKAQVEGAFIEQPSVYNGEELVDNGCTYAIKVNRQENIVTVYALDEQGYYTVPVRCMRCSTANDENTPLGLFNTSDRYDWAWLLGGVYGQYAYQIHGDILFHSVPYETDSKDRLETWEYNKLGTHASMGCVRLCVADAKWIFDNCEYGTQVNIFDSDYDGPMGKPANPYIISNAYETGWDPTDMTEGNPYMTEGRIFGAMSRTIEAGEPFDESAGVMAFSKEMADMTEELKIEGSVDENVCGSYEISYSFMDGISTVKKDIVITVVDSRLPVIEALPEEMHIASDSYNGNTRKLAELIGSYISAYDDGMQITDIATSADEVSDKRLQAYLYVDTSELDTVRIGEAGTYTVWCCAVDRNGNQSKKFDIKIMME
ncbi:MAG: DUF5011 domain-containing protein [Coprococcus sp.]|nr:DUF5011 domain-containing protein [Coprococcus sp.]